MFLALEEAMVTATRHQIMFTSINFKMTDHKVPLHLMNLT